MGTKWRNMGDGIRVKTRKDEDGRVVVTAVAVEAPDRYSLSLALREVRLGNLEAKLNHRVVPRRRLKLPEPQGPDYPDAFYKRVAETYVTLVAAGSKRPTQEIAEANGYSATRVSHWVRKARGLGYLPPGRKGKL